MSDRNNKFPVEPRGSQRPVDEAKLVQDYALALQKTLEAKRRDPSERSTKMHEELLAAVEALSNWERPNPDRGRVIDLFHDSDDPGDQERDT
ncbi:MAG: hypothetical protein AAFQ24_01725 [Pseudomonadota bacterium]